MRWSDFVRYHATPPLLGRRRRSTPCINVGEKLGQSVDRRVGLDLVCGDGGVPPQNGTHSRLLRAEDVVVGTVADECGTCGVGDAERGEGRSEGLGMRLRMSHLTRVETLVDEEVQSVALEEVLVEAARPVSVREQPCTEPPFAERSKDFYGVGFVPNVGCPCIEVQDAGLLEEGFGEIRSDLGTGVPQ